MAEMRTAAAGDEPKKDKTPKKPQKPPQVPGTSAFKDLKGKTPWERTVEFARDSWIEVTRKTTWLTRPELIRSTAVVLAVIIAISFYLAFWDYVGAQAMKLLLGTAR
jgi:preprotein translocase SecE subunit